MAGIALGAALSCLLALTAPPARAAPDDPYFDSRGAWGQDFPDQWGLAAIGFLDRGDRNSAWAIETGQSRPVIVAVLDTGLDYFHPDISRDNIWRNHAETPNGVDDDGNGYIDDLIGWNFVENDNKPWDLSGHGTHVAGIIGAASNNGHGVAGINWGVQIMPLKIMNFTGRGRTVPLAEAIYYAVDKGASVINLSLGAEDDSRIQREAVDYARRNGVLVVAAAGNSALDTAIITPARLDNVITVVATGPDGERAPFSNFGDAVDIAAPGVDILSLRARHTDFALVVGLEDYEAGSAYLGPENQFYRASGTSFSAPFVSGVASLIYAKNPGIEPDQVKRMLLHSASDIDFPGIDRNTGFGLLDARAALSASPDFFLEASISGVQVVQEGNAITLQVLGTIDADKLDSAWIELGEGKAPDSFEKASKTIRKPVRDGVLGEIDAQLLRSSTTWVLRLVGEHRNGTKRETRFELNLG